VLLHLDPTNAMSLGGAGHQVLSCPADDNTTFLVLGCSVYMFLGVCVSEPLSRPRLISEPSWVGSVAASSARLRLLCNMHEAHAACAILCTRAVKTCVVGPHILRVKDPFRLPACSMQYAPIRRDTPLLVFATGVFWSRPDILQSKLGRDGEWTVERLRRLEDQSVCIACGFKGAVKVGSGQMTRYSWDGPLPRVLVPPRYPLPS